MKVAVARLRKLLRGPVLRATEPTFYERLAYIVGRASFWVASFYALMAGMAVSPLWLGLAPIGLLYWYWVVWGVQVFEEFRRVYRSGKGKR